MQSSAQVWLPARQAAELLGHSDPRTIKRDLRLHPNKYTAEMQPGKTGDQYRILLTSLPIEAQTKYWKAHAALSGQVVENDQDEMETDMDIYARAPGWARRKADKYLPLIRATDAMKGKEIKLFIRQWNQLHPEMATSYPCLMTAKKEYKAKGMASLLAGYGHSAGQSTVREEWFEFFKGVHLKEGGPSILHSWMLTLGFARRLDASITQETFPSYKAFERLLEKRLPEDAIYMAREGESRWYRRYASHGDRNYRDIEPGKVWVSDHAQVDVMTILPNGKPCFPWVTVWRCFKSGKWLGWDIHPEAPNSDHIFQAFYYAACAFGIPDDIIIDNGKDYRSKSLTGGRGKHRVEVDEVSTRSLVGGLKIDVHFALPYNAQTKPIERDFLKNKGWFSKTMPGYRGGNVVERPEALEKEIKSGKIMSYEDFKGHFNGFIEKIFNNMPSQGKVLKGQSPNAYWNNHFAEARLLRRVDPQALKLFCARTSNDVAIGRNGIRDSELGLVYWAEWMTTQKGKKVYLRRDVKAYQEAWVFLAENDEYLGQAVLVQSINAIVRTDIDRNRLKDLMAQKGQDLKLKRAMISAGDRPSPDQILDYMASGLSGLTGATEAPTLQARTTSHFEITPMDRAIAKERQADRAGTADISKLLPPTKPKRKLYAFAADKQDADEARRKAGS